MGKIREEITWVQKDHIYFTSLIMWNRVYEPFQAVVFRINVNKNKIIIKYYLSIEQCIYHHANIIQLKTDQDEEMLFFVTTNIREKLDSYLSGRKPPQENEDNDPDLDSLKSILKDIFLEDIVMEAYRQSSPDFGFYSLSSNFHILKTMILKQRKPTLEEEVRRLMKKYNQIK